MHDPIVGTMNQAMKRTNIVPARVVGRQNRHRDHCYQLPIKLAVSPMH